MSTLDSGIRKRLASCPDTARPAWRSHGRRPPSLSPRTAEPAAAGRPAPDAHPHVD